MTIKNHTIQMLLTLLLLFIGAASGQAQHWDPSIDPEDTLDEVDLKALKDKIPMSRKNVVKDSHTPGMINNLDYSLDDYYSPDHQTFISKRWRHIYLGINGSYEKITEQVDGYKITPVGELYGMIGKDFSMKHSARLLIGGGWGYENDTKFTLKRLSLKADYLFNLSTNFCGYNPSRKVGFSALLGLGAHYTSMESRQSKIVPEAHLGMQVQIYTGPRGYLNIEPYIGIATDNLDLSETRNWKGYDTFWGVQANYSFYIGEQLSPESKLRLLQYRSRKDRVVDSTTIDSWRTSWFVEAAGGIAFLKSDDIPLKESRGSNISIGVGRWFSPVVGGRFTFASRNVNCSLTNQVGTATQGPRTIYSPMRYTTGRLELLFNPLAYLRNFTWDNTWGLHIVAGGEYGMVRKTITDTENMRAYSVGYDLGLHVWYKLSEDLQAFIEPRFSHNIYTLPYSNVALKRLFTNDYYGLDLGLTMFIRSEKFHDLYEFDDVQKFNYRYTRGLRIGLGAGMINVQRVGYDYGGGRINWSATGFIEYQFNFLHAVRGSLELMNFSRHALLPCTNSNISSVYTGNDGNHIFTVNSKMLLGALDYQVNLTNLCSGVLKNRNFDLEAFIGPAISLHLSQNATIAAEEPTYSSPVLGTEDKKPHFGANVGLKLTKYIWKGISLYFTPNIYFIKNNTPELNTHASITNGNGIQMYQSFTLGLQYKCGKARLNPLKMQKLKIRYNEHWKEKGEKQADTYLQKQREKQQKRRQEYNEWLAKQKKKQANRKPKKYTIIEVEAKD